MGVPERSGAFMPKQSRLRHSKPFPHPGGIERPPHTFINGSGVQCFEPTPYRHVSFLSKGAYGPRLRRELTVGARVWKRQGHLTYKGNRLSGFAMDQESGSRNVDGSQDMRHLAKPRSEERIMKATRLLVAFLIVFSAAVAEWPPDR